VGSSSTTTRTPRTGPWPLRAAGAGRWHQLFSLLRLLTLIFPGLSTTGSCSAVLSTFRGVHLITQSVCVGLARRIRTIDAAGLLAP
jgi:hypothetical protein